MFAACYHISIRATTSRCLLISQFLCVKTAMHGKGTRTTVPILPIHGPCPTGNHRTIVDSYKSIDHKPLGVEMLGKTECRKESIRKYRKPVDDHPGTLLWGWTLLEGEDVRVHCTTYSLALADDVCSVLSYKHPSDYKPVSIDFTVFVC